MDNCYEQMIETSAEHDLFESDDALLLMVSGGSDSTALAYLAAKLREEGKIGALAMLHMNHLLRGEESNGDAQFVAKLAEQLDIPLFNCEMDIAREAQRTGGNIEAVGRHERYVAATEALASMCEHEGIPYAQGHIATAHTADDRVENFYMRSIVGTGPGGFRSMLYENGKVVRPLLDCTREQLREFLSTDATVKDESGHLWREDATNAHTDKFRAYVRHNMVPVAKEWNPKLMQTLVRTMNLIAEEDDMLDSMASKIIDNDVEFIGASSADGFVLLPTFCSHPLPMKRRVVHELLKSMLGDEVRVDTSSVDAVLEGIDEDAPASGYVTNIQGDLAVSANKRGIRVEPMSEFRARRKR